MIAMTEPSRNSFDEEIARYQKQMMDYYEIGKKKNPDYDTVAAGAIPVPEPEKTPAPLPEAAVSPRPALLPNGPAWTEEQEQAYLAQNPNTGYIKTAVVTARGAIPLKGAEVTIYKTIDGATKIFAQGKTDESGDFANVALPTPSKELSKHPSENGVRPYAAYDILVTNPDYIPVKSYNVPVFEDIVSIQLVNMIPLSAAQSPDQVEEIYESEDTL